MLKYLILSTPRCGSSTFMNCANLVFGPDSFVREPLNLHEDQKFHPEALRDMGIEARAEYLCSVDGAISGIKHVYSPPHQTMSQPWEIRVLRRILAVTGLRVILLWRRNVAHQFISMEVANQTGDWWSTGPSAVPAIVRPFMGGGPRVLEDIQIVKRLDGLRRSRTFLKDICTQAGSNLIELCYEDLLVHSANAASTKVIAALAHFDAAVANRGNRFLVKSLIEKGQRFAEVDDLYGRVAAQYPSLR